ncbi:DUF262 domain-containing protein [Sediminibacterium salmoneum]|uniref:DUF262 domain-containing protein n=1 Tax=Sediminibacterium salmoneum TaxID=426421 RepID=UPI0004B5F8C3|nr:DUF262 domain-containing protein [Sediminibacterium salmoneum]
MEIIEKNKQLQTEIESVRKEIKTDNFSMAVRELVQVYKDGDLELFPSYQRLFRWEDDQKTRFIESLLMGIPTPPIFIAQKKGSKWTIVDGLQRVSTILHLMGLFKDNKGDVRPTFKFTSTEKLPSIEGLEWNELDEDIQRIIRMSKLDLKIILVEDNITAQYELFKRLNTGAVALSPQEIRNCLIIMLDEKFYNQIDLLKSYHTFKEAVKLTDTKIEIEYPMELILRYLIIKYNKISFANYNLSSDLLSDFIDKETARLIQDKEFNLENEIVTFKRVFDLIHSVLGENSFRKYNSEKLDFEGMFIQTAYEGILPGLANNIDFYEGEGKSLLKDKVIRMYSEEGFNTAAKRGNKAISRIQGLISFSNSYFANYAN